MKKVILTLLLSLNLCCTKEPVVEVDNTTYYKFTFDDYNYIINYNYATDQILTYQNQFGDQLHFKVILNKLAKEGQYHSTFLGGSSLDYYYDNKIIKMEIIEHQSSYRDNLVIYNFSKSQGIFKNGINLPIWNVSTYTFYDDIERPFNIGLTQFNNSNKSQLNINGHIFQKVVIIDSNSNIDNQTYYGGLLTRNINKVYYDYDFGIIQFEDINGKQWKVIYP